MITPLPLRKAALMAAVLTAGARLFGQGAPPMLTDDTAPPDLGELEVAVGMAAEHTVGSTTIEAPTLDLAYGIHKNVELGYSVAWMGEHASGESSRWGLGKSDVDIKWRFLGDGEHGLQVAFTPTIEFPTPGSRAVDRGIVEPHTYWLLPFEFEDKVGDYGLCAEIEPVLATNREDENRWEGGFVVNREIVKGWTPCVEIRCVIDDRANRSEWILNFGSIIKLSEKYDLLLAAGRDLSNSMGDKVSFIGYVGIQTTF